MSARRASPHMAILDAAPLHRAMGIPGGPPKAAHPDPEAAFPRRAASAIRLYGAHPTEFLDSGKAAIAVFIRRAPEGTILGLSKAAESWQQLPGLGCAITV